MFEKVTSCIYEIVFRFTSSHRAFRILETRLCSKAGLCLQCGIYANRPSPLPPHFRA